MVYTARGSPCRAACTTTDGPEALLGTRPLLLEVRSALVSRRVLRPARALQLEEALLAREPQRVVPQLAGIFTLGHRVDHRPEHARALAVVQHERGHAECLELVHHALVLALDLLARARVGERRRPQPAVQARLGERVLDHAGILELLLVHEPRTTQRVVEAIDRVLTVLAPHERQ